MRSLQPCLIVERFGVLDVAVPRPVQMNKVHTNPTNQHRALAAVARLTCTAIITTIAHVRILSFHLFALFNLVVSPTIDQIPNDAPSTQILRDLLPQHILALTAESEMQGVVRLMVPRSAMRAAAAATALRVQVHSQIDTLQFLQRSQNPRNAVEDRAQLILDQKILLQTGFGA
ncbi:hypothetical protein E8E12_001682 [Didymella heteroderae]|uniref:Uncharacterized protein n=1 Tax=Didymella heteroderae TaxID=1769908 RepID=A0A9P4WL44_9PLEO|nr:hypothetical protein E8E12_001682 [Didymella heteroderae]